MRTHRWIVAVAALCGLAACQHWDWAQKPNTPDGEDCKQYSVQESLGFYQTLLPPRGFYQIFAVTEPPDPIRDQGKLPYSFVVFRVRDSRLPRGGTEPVVERIIGPVRGKEEMTDLFSIFRRYASTPPAGYYCWQNDCRGKYSPAGDPDPRDPYPPDLPNHPGIQSSVGYTVTPVPAGSYVLRAEPGRGTGGSGPGTGGAGCTFAPREGTVLTAEIVENLRASAIRVGKALDDVPEVPNPPRSYPADAGYRQPPFQDPYKR